MTTPRELPAAAAGREQLQPVDACSGAVFERLRVGERGLGDRDRVRAR